MNLVENGGVVVLKQGDLSTATEYFCSIVLADLGLACPEIRVLSLDEWQAAAKAASEVGCFYHRPSLQSFSLMLSQVPFTVQGAGDTLSDDRNQGRGGVIQAFIPGFTMKDARVAQILKQASDSEAIRAFLTPLSS